MYGKKHLMILGAVLIAIFFIAVNSPTTKANDHHSIPTITSMAPISEPQRYNHTLINQLFPQTPLLASTPVITQYLPLILNSGPASAPPEPGELLALNDGPTLLGSPTTLSASITNAETFDYTWDFGDGSPLDNSGAVVTHTYATIGVFTATVQASRPAETIQATSLVTIQDIPPAAGFTILGPTSPNEVVNFSNISTGSNLTFTWNFGDGTPISADIQPSHVYTQAKIYTVVMTATNSRGDDVISAPLSIETPLRGDWSFDNLNHSYQDRSAYLNHLTTHMPVTSRVSLIGTAADFEADQANYLAIEDTVQYGLDIPDSLTLLGWINPESFSDEVRVMAAKSEQSPDDLAYRFYLRSNNRLGFAVSPDGTSADPYTLEATLSPKLQADTWYYVAAVFDAEAQTLAIYLNGQLVGSRSVSYAVIHNSSAPFVLGAELDDGNFVNNFDGQLDEWRVYNAALAGDEIEQVGPPDLLPPNPAGFSFIIDHPAAKKQPSAVGKRLRGAFTYQDKIYWGFGDSEKNTGPIDIIPFDPDTLTFLAKEYSAKTEVIYHYRLLSNNKLYIPHPDPFGDAGKVYSRKDATGWTDAPTIGLWHVYDTIEMGGNLYVVGSEYSYADVYKTSDEIHFERILRQSGRDVPGSGHARFMFGFVWNDELYVQASDRFGTNRNPKSAIYDGKKWRAGPDLLPKRGHGMYSNHFAGQVVYEGMDDRSPGYLYAFDGQTARAIRANVMNYVIYGDGLFALEADGKIVKTTDLANWVTVGRAEISEPTAITIAGNRLFVGNATAKIYGSNFTIETLISK